MPHFFALSWMYREDYKRGGFAMVPVNDPSGSRTADLIIRYTLCLSALPVLSSLAGTTSWMFTVEGLALNGAFLYYGQKFNKKRTNGNARKVFLTSLWYLPCLLGLFILHSKNWSEKSRPEVEEKVRGKTGRIRRGLTGLTRASNAAKHASALGRSRRSGTRAGSSASTRVLTPRTCVPFRTPRTRQTSKSSANIVFSHNHCLNSFYVIPKGARVEVGSTYPQRARCSFVNIIS